MQQPKPSVFNLERQLLSAWPLSVWGQTRLLVAISGGADSVACLIALRHLAESPDKIHAAHFNHRWRGQESDDDARFVRELCDQMGIDLHVGMADPLSPGPRTEQAARQARYSFLAHTAYRLGARYVVTAHTADDRAETVLHNLFRGSGLQGVCQPTRSRPFDDQLVLVRPLLDCSRIEIESYLDLRGQAYREDSSNADQRYKRNFIRHSLLPLVESEYGPDVRQRLAGFATLAEDALAAIQDLASTWSDQNRAKVQQAHICGDLETGENDQIFIACSIAAAAPWPIVQLAVQQSWREQGWPLQGMARRHWHLIRDALHVPSSDHQWHQQFDLPGQIRCYHRKDWLKLARAQQTTAN